MISSYQKNHLGPLLFQEVAIRKPSKVVEFGVLDGYSTLWLAAGLQWNGDNGHLYAYDLWDDYPYKHGYKGDVYELLNRAGLASTTSLLHADFFDWIKDPEPFDMLHLDISNDGDIIELAIEKLKDQIKQGSIIIFEGGSEERDLEPWMMRYRKRPIKNIKYNYKVLTDKWPSISIVDGETLCL